MSIIKHKEVFSVCLSLSLSGCQVTRTLSGVCSFIVVQGWPNKCFLDFMILLFSRGTRVLKFSKHYWKYTMDNVGVATQLCSVMTPTALHSCKFSPQQKTCYQALLCLPQSSPVLTNQRQSWGGSVQSEDSDVTTMKNSSGSARAVL